ncbi:MAG: 3-oxoacyl-ACP reductase FabG [Phycisphaerales bacterium]|jgi:3-oxoacyl-[acyl-carrier protein] reductase|nr:3-oxoacyl-ACP reductase FabG [Phycisphaerales bacterium]
MIPIDLSGKVALITGGSQGLGEEFARTLHRAGAAVAINYFPDPAGVNQKRAQSLATDLGQRTIVYGGDVRDLTMMQGTARQVVADLGRLDILINNAGILRDKTLKNLDAEHWQDVIDTNLTGVFNACKGAVPVMSDGGRIISLASIAAVVGFFGQSNYAAAKAGVMGLTRVLSRELARRRITVNAVAPGVVLTEMGKSIPDEVRAEMLKNIPLGRLGEPSEIAGAVLFLCSDLASYITGQTLHVNGGWIAP